MKSFFIHYIYQLCQEFQDLFHKQGKLNNLILNRISKCYIQHLKMSYRLHKISLYSFQGNYM